MKHNLGLKARITCTEKLLIHICTDHCVVDWLSCGHWLRQWRDTELVSTRVSLSMSPPLEVIAVLGVTLISRLVEIFNETWIENFLRKTCVPKYCCNIWSNWGRKRRQWSLLVVPQTHFTDCSIWILFIWMTPLSLLRNSRFPISTPEYAQLVVCTDSAGNFSRPETTVYNTTVSIQGQLIF